MFLDVLGHIESVQGTEVLDAAVGTAIRLELAVVVDVLLNLEFHR